MADEGWWRARHTIKVKTMQPRHFKLFYFFLFGFFSVLRWGCTPRSCNSNCSGLHPQVSTSTEYFTHGFCLRVWEGGDVLINQRARIEGTLFATLICLLLADLFVCYDVFLISRILLQRLYVTAAHLHNDHKNAGDPRSGRHEKCDDTAKRSRKSQTQAHHTSALQCVSIETDDWIGWERIAGEPSSALSPEWYFFLLILTFYILDHIKLNND